MSKHWARLHIQRGAPGSAARIETFNVPFEPGNSLLDGLRWIRATQDASLAIRYSCINANACKECMLVLDGEVVYACTQRLREATCMSARSPTRRWYRTWSVKSRRATNGCCADAPCLS